VTTAGVTTAGVTTAGVTTAGVTTAGVTTAGVTTAGVKLSPEDINISASFLVWNDLNTAPENPFVIDLHSSHVK